MKKIIGMAVLGLLVAGILFAGYRLFFSEDSLRSPLPREEGINVIFISPTKAP
ncbi:MAG: hypothetical protein N2691_04905 [Patescibacteria group bacterium]|nr:hypothetical protein [Patescibacteria group bacterium]